MKTAMILAAGRGERLRPLTESVPKPLCLVRGKPLIEYHLENLAKAGFNRIIINHAYLGSKIRHYLGDGSRWQVEICYSPEPPGGLETGGGIVNALPLIGDNPFITVNADIFTNFNFNNLHIDSIKDIHLVVVHRNPELHHFGDFGLVNGNQLITSNRLYTFSGIACYHPRVFEQATYGRHSVTPLIHQYVRENRATACLHQGIWFDIGSSLRLNLANN